MLPLIGAGVNFILSILSAGVRAKYTHKGRNMGMNLFKSSGFCLLALFLVLGVFSYAQTSTASLQGTITDPSGSALVGAKVALSVLGTAAILPFSISLMRQAKDSMITPALVPVIAVVSLLIEGAMSAIAQEVDDEHKEEVGSFFGAAIDFCHEKKFLAISIFQGFAHQDFALALVVVPTVVHERDAAIDGGANERDALFVGEAVFGDVKSSHADGGNVFAGASESAVEHVSFASAGRRGEGNLVHGVVLLMGFLGEGCGQCGCGRADRGCLEEIAAFHVA